ncbi:MAG: DnaD domain protein [Christensenellales bacterium]
MSFVKFSDSVCMFDVTPLENLYIEEYMRRAPGDFVKVYIYGLMHCYHAREATTRTFAHALSLEENEVLNAFNYWERQGLIRRSGNSYEYMPAKAVIELDRDTASVLYKYKDFNNRLQELLPGRLLLQNDFQRAYDWIEIYNLEPDAVLVLISWCVSRKGPKISFAYIDKVAKDWASLGIITLERAEEHIRRDEALRSAVGGILAHIGIKRAPTVDEHKLYSKWTSEWGFTREAVTAACLDMSRTRNPNMAYLDKVLESYRAQGILTAEDITAAQSGKADLNRSVGEMLYNLAIKGAPAPAHIEMYKRWSEEWGFEHKSIIHACKHAALEGNPSPAYVEAELWALKTDGITTLAQVKAYYEESRETDHELRAVFNCAGIKRSPSATDRKWYARATSEYGMSSELICHAASLAQEARNKTAFIQKVLDEWHKNGVKTPDEARARKPKHSQSGTKYDMHDYSDVADTLYNNY